mmetsp:Transcript_14178/g.31489  ORF Transcript_14178/g.31489 Transcript_14178/m.31489 type:complete len:402 (+) Transcript_14178:90-1295(+)
MVTVMQQQRAQAAAAAAAGAGEGSNVGSTFGAVFDVCTRRCTRRAAFAPLHRTDKLRREDGDGTASKAEAIAEQTAAKAALLPRCAVAHQGGWTEPLDHRETDTREFDDGATCTPPFDAAAAPSDLEDEELWPKDGNSDGDGSTTDTGGSGSGSSPRPMLPARCAAVSMASTVEPDDAPEQSGRVSRLDSLLSAFDDFGSEMAMKESDGDNALPNLPVLSTSGFNSEVFQADTADAVRTLDDLWEGRIDWDDLPEEDYYGAVEYKWRLLGVAKSRISKLVTQMRWRQVEGKGRCMYVLGVRDDGRAVGINRREHIETVRTLQVVASSLQSVACLRSMRVGRGRYCSSWWILQRSDALCQVPWLDLMDDCGQPAVADKDALAWLDLAVKHSGRPAEQANTQQ